MSVVSSAEQGDCFRVLVYTHISIHRLQSLDSRSTLSSLHRPSVAAHRALLLLLSPPDGRLRRTHRIISAPSPLSLQTLSPSLFSQSHLSIQHHPFRSVQTLQPRIPPPLPICPTEDSTNRIGNAAINFFPLITTQRPPLCISRSLSHSILVHCLSPSLRHSPPSPSPPRLISLASPFVPSSLLPPSSPLLPHWHSRLSSRPPDTNAQRARYLSFED